MTNEQAIEVINGHIKDSSIAYGTFTGQALRMAIEALKAQLSQEGTTKGTTTDTISRQAAIGEVKKHYRAYDNDLLELITFDIERLPPAQPEQRWIPCSERLPDNRVDVLVCYRAWQQYAKRYVYAIVNGWYARKHSVNENVFSEWEDDCDYKEDEDEFYIQEGWYEFTTQGNGDLMNWYIGDAEVVAWMPLPKPYMEGDTT